MQVSLTAAMNGARPTFGKQLSLSPKSSDLAQTLNHISTPVYHITTDDSSEDKFNLGDEAVTYTTQYYTTVEPQSTASSPLMQPESPGRDSGMLTPTSVSSKESSSSDVASDGPAGGSLSGGATGGMQQNICVTSSGGLVHSDGLVGVSGGVSNGTTVAGATVKNWTYEDQFKQLYNLSPEPERKEFLDKLFDFMQKKGSPITRIPIMAKQPLDLYRLFKLVVERGGLVEVIKKKAWRNVAKELNLPASITSAAFTMRSQYVKYLYPYECETVKLSDPQELQMAIDSNKRDRRHSDTIPLLSGENQGVITTQGMQLINSPPVPHASGPPYSGGFIVATPSGQLVQLQPQVPGVPIVMPSPHNPRSDSSRTVSEDGEEDNSSPREPPAKKMALEANQVKVALSADSRLPYVHTTAGNFIMTPAGTPIVAHPSMGPPPQFIQMAAPHHPGHIPIVIPTPTAASSTPSPLETSASIVARSIRGSCQGDTETIMTKAVAAHDLQRRTISVLNGPPVPIAAIPPQNSTAVTTSTLSPGQHGLLTMPNSAHIPGLLMAPVSPDKKKAESAELQGESVRKTVVTSESSPSPVSTSLKSVPFANISIQSAGGQTESGSENGGSTDASLLVTLQLNNVVYQGVLFAKPNSVSLSTSSFASTR